MRLILRLLAPAGTAAEAAAAASLMGEDLGAGDVDVADAGGGDQHGFLLRVGLVELLQGLLHGVSAGALPLYGTCVILIPAMELNSSVPRWGAAPTPEVP